jgi:hypothetical protein
MLNNKVDAKSQSQINPFVVPRATQAQRAPSAPMRTQHLPWVPFPKCA